MPRAGSQGKGNRLQDRAELAVVDAHHDRAASVGPARLGPAPRNHGKVLDIERDEHSLFFCRQRQQLFVSAAVQLALLVGGPDVVTSITNKSYDVICYFCV